MRTLITLQYCPAMSSVASFYGLKAEKPNGQTYDFDTLKGKVVLVVNTASKCGFTPQYTGLEKLCEFWRGGAGRTPAASGRRIAGAWIAESEGLSCCAVATEPCYRSGVAWLTA